MNKTCRYNLKFVYVFKDALLFTSFRLIHHPYVHFMGGIRLIEKFQITPADGWIRTDIPNGVHLFKPNGDMLQIQMLADFVSDAEDKALLQALAEKYNGSPLEEVELLGIKFYKTTYSAYGKEMTFYSGVKSGEQLKIQINGKSYQENDDMKAMLESVVFTFH